MVRVVNLGEYIVTSHPDDTLRTYSLASCVGVVASCPVCSLMGMAHVVLPGKPPSRIANLEEQMKYAEVLVPAMLREMNGRHSCKEKGAPNVKLYGGIDSIFNCAFRIGERNLQSVKRVLNEMNTLYDATNTGGNVYRSLIASVGTGQIIVVEGILRSVETVGQH